MKDWFKLNRSIFNNKWWLAEPFTKSQSWIDLIGHANYEDGILFIRNNEIKVKRGQIAWGERYMAKRWRWSRGKVRRFINELIYEQQIVPQKNSIISLYSIVNYEKYQGSKNETVPPTVPQTVPQTVPLLKKNIKKNINNNTKGEELAKQYLEKWNEVFKSKFKRVKEITPLLNDWLKDYTMDEVFTAIEKMRGDDYWGNKGFEPTTLIRKKDQKGNPVDRIGRMISKSSFRI